MGLLKAWRLRKRGWGTFDLRPEQAEVHVMPVNDLVEHDQEDDCWCRPRVELVEGSRPDCWMVVHDALDGRE